MDDEADHEVYLISKKVPSEDIKDTSKVEYKMQASKVSASLAGQKFIETFIPSDWAHNKAGAG